MQYVSTRVEKEKHEGTVVEEKLAYFTLMDTCLQSESFNGHTQLDLWPFFNLRRRSTDKVPGH